MLKASKEECGTIAGLAVMTDDALDKFHDNGEVSVYLFLYESNDKHHNVAVCSY